HKSRTLRKPRSRKLDPGSFRLSAISVVVVPVLSRVQLCYLVEASGSEQEEQDAETRLYQAYVRPFLLKRRDERRKEGGTALMALSQGQVVSAEGQEFGVRALDPIARCGALDESTAVFISHIETAALDRVHVLPYGDSLPSAYEFDLFRDFLRPFFQSHPS
ncbi:unnamed protein product, partial [Prorocentrum cordatum]